MKHAVPLKVLLAAPRSFCAGVERAIGIVESCLSRYGRPIYVRHAIIHNEHVLEELRQKGVIFVEELSEVPDGAPVVLSAHGVAPEVVDLARRRRMPFVNATCPLVARVHQEAERHHLAGRMVLVIGKAAHPEVVGILGHLAKGRYRVIEDLAAARSLELPEGIPLAYVTQTTLSVEDTAQIVEALRQRFPQLAAPRSSTICYATTNRQKAVQAIAPQVEALLVLGSPTSSNSTRLTEVARRSGCAQVRLVPHPTELSPDWSSRLRSVGITAGASAPEYLVQQTLNHLSQFRQLCIEEVTVTEEQTQFHLPEGLFPKIQGPPAPSRLTVSPRKLRSSSADPQGHEPRHPQQLSWA